MRSPMAVGEKDFQYLFYKFNVQKNGTQKGNQA